MDVLLRSRPIGAEEFNHLMRAVGPFEPHPFLAIALSGGPDSLALALLLKRWTEENSGTLFAVTVDHGLRSESAEEAHCVSRWMEACLISHTILKWQGQKPSTHLQEKARKARHSLLEDYCRQQKIQHLFFAHHQEDQAETFLARFLHKSGIDGLSAMVSLQEGPFVRKLRPLLKIPKSRLYATLEAFQQPFLTDPSNKNLNFCRVQLRAQKEDFEALGISTSVIESSIEKNSWVRESLEKETIRALFQGVSVSELGYASLDLKKFRRFSFEIARRVLERTILLVGGKPYGPRSESLIPLVKLFQFFSQDSVVKTLNQTLLKKKQDTLFVIRETAANKKMNLNDKEIFEISQNQDFFVWEDRFLIEVEQERIKSFRERSLGPLGKKGVLFLKHQEVLTEDRRLMDKKMPQEVYDDILASLPALWKNEKLLSVPHLNWGMLFWQESGLKVLKPCFFPKNSLAPPLIHINFMENNF